MPRERQLTPPEGSDADRIQLQGVAVGCAAMPHALVWRASMTFASAGGLAYVASCARSAIRRRTLATGVLQQS